MADRDFRVKNGLHVSSNAYIANSITRVNSVQFNLGANVSPAVGQLDWAFDDATLEVGLNDQVNLQIGQETLIRGTNLTGSTITNGTVVMISGAQGNGGDIRVLPATADGSVASRRIVGLATQNIANNTTGFITVLGKVRGLNTSTFVVGDELYANPTVAGGLSNTQPIAPNVKVSIGTVLTSHPNNGVVLVRPNYGSAIEEDENVFIQDPQVRQPLVWTGNNRFENSTFRLSDLDDVVFGTPNEGALLSYSGGSWVDTTQIEMSSITSLQYYYADLDASHGILVKAPNVMSTNYTLTLPPTAGSNGQVLIGDGTGQLSFGTISGSGITDVVQDTTPQLGGNLDVNGFSIVSVSNGNINLSPNGTGSVIVNKELNGLLLRSTQSSGDEGGQLNLALAAANTTLSGEVAIDINQNRLRIFETGGSNRGAYIDLAAASAGVGSNLLTGGSGGITTGKAIAMAIVFG